MSFNPGPSSQSTANVYELTTANMAKAAMQGGAYAVTATDSFGNVTGWTEGGVAYTATYANGVLSTVVGAGVTKTITYPNGRLNVVIS